MNQNETMDPQDLELLAGHALGNLSDDESDRVTEMLRSHPAARDVLAELELTASAYQLAVMRSARASLPGAEELPASLASRISTEGRAIVEKRSGARDRFGSVVQSSVAPQTGSGGPGSVSTTRSGPHAREWIGWLCAAAAVLVAVSLWKGGEIADPVVATNRTASQARAALLEESDSVIRVAWAPGTTPFEQSVSGDVVWDPATQKGYMRFANMPVNDPSVEQYQLWIIDPQRDDEPVDGGVFDITESGEVVVEIDAKLNVIDPAAFAVTIEKPGGVVVSTQERLPLLAAVKG